MSESVGRSVLLVAEPVLFIGLTTGEAQVVAAVGLAFVGAATATAATLSFLEARRTRKQAVRPALALDLVSVGAFYVEVGIANVGQGAALDVEVELAFVPDGDGREPVRNRWSWPLIRSGERFLFAPPKVGQQERPDLEMWAAVYPRVTLTGTVRDQLGHRCDVDLELRDLRGLRGRAMAARLAGLRETQEQRATKAVAGAATAISSTLERVAAALERRADGD